MIVGEPLLDTVFDPHAGARWSTYAVCIAGVLATGRWASRASRSPARGRLRPLPELTRTLMAEHGTQRVLDVRRPKAEDRGPARRPARAGRDAAAGGRVGVHAAGAQGGGGGCYALRPC